jgi:hypothetical protein
MQAVSPKKEAVFLFTNQDKQNLLQAAVTIPKYRNEKRYK